MVVGITNCPVIICCFLHLPGGTLHWHDYPYSEIPKGPLEPWTLTSHHGIHQVTTTPEPESNVTSDDGNVSDVSTTTTSTPYLGLTDSELVPLIDWWGGNTGWILVDRSVYKQPPPEKRGWLHETEWNEAPKKITGHKSYQTWCQFMW